MEGRESDAEGADGKWGEAGEVARMRMTAWRISGQPTGGRYWRVCARAPRRS
jgi:hypothetical protein